MIKDWQALTRMTGNRPLRIERVALTDEAIAIEGSFELPPLARLTAEDQVFIAVFVKCHGSIKQMEKHFGISYPTVKARLNRIGEKLEFVEIEKATDKNDILDQLKRGKISVDDAVDLIRKKNMKNDE